MLSVAGDSRLSWAGWNRVGGGLRATSPACCGRRVSPPNPSGSARSDRWGGLYDYLKVGEVPHPSSFGVSERPPTLARFTIPPPCPTPAAASPGLSLSHPLGPFVPSARTRLPPVRRHLNPLRCPTPTPAWACTSACAHPPAHTALCRPPRPPLRTLTHSPARHMDKPGMGRPPQSLPSRLPPRRRSSLLCEHPPQRAGQPPLQSAHQPTLQLALRSPGTRLHLHLLQLAPTHPRTDQPDGWRAARVDAGTESSWACWRIVTTAPARAALPAARAVTPCEPGASSHQLLAYRRHGAWLRCSLSIPAQHLL